MGSQGFELAQGIRIGGGARLVYIAGPCVIESADGVLTIAEKLRALSERQAVPLVFKTSFDKANRSSISSYRGPGLEAGLDMLARVKRETGLPVLVDVHEPAQAALAAKVADVLQVPAFLCRQTDLLLACGRTGLPVNVKKGQFLAPEDVANLVDKVKSTNNQRVTVTERGASFGYHNLVVDVRAFPVMRRFAPVVYDLTHSLQLPGGLGHATGGAREFHPFLARAAAAAGIDGLFAEVHADPPNALSDATTQLTVAELEEVVVAVETIVEALRGLEP